MTSSLLEQLIEALRVLPGVGQKSAQRMAYHVLERERDGGQRLADALGAAVETHRPLRALPRLQRNRAVRDLRQRLARRAPAVRGGIAGRPPRDRAGHRLSRPVFRAAGPAEPARRHRPARTRPGPARRAPGRRRGAGTDHRHQSRPSKARRPRITWRSSRASTTCGRAGSRTACRWAANWNTSTAARCRMRSAAAAKCR